MGELRCYLCGKPVAVRDDTELVDCTSCEMPLNLPTLERWRAAGDLLATLSDPNLDPDLRVQVTAAVTQYQQNLSREGLAMAKLTKAATERAAAEDPGKLEAAAGDAEPSTPEPQASGEPGGAPGGEGVPAAASRSRRRRSGPSFSASPSLWSRLGPLFAENLLFALGGFLLLAGAIYLVTTAWTSMSGTQRLLVIVGCLELFGGVLYGTARLVRDKEGLGNTERVLLFVATALVPVAMVAASQVGSLGWGILLGSVVLASAWIPLLRLVQKEDPRLYPWLPVAFTALTAVILFAPRLTGAPILAVTGVSAAVIFACAHLGRALRDPRAELLRGWPQRCSPAPRARSPATSR